MAKALLMLTGGRGIPDMLVIKYLRPDIIFNLTTKQGLRTAQHLAQLSRTEFGCQMEVLPTVNLNKEKEVKDACINVLRSQNHAEWVISITSAPKTMGIFAVDVAREHNIPCWHLNTDDREVISFAKDIPIDVDQLFEASVEQYMKLYERRYEIPKGEFYRSRAESWHEVAKLLAHMPEGTQRFLGALRQELKKKYRGEAIVFAAEPQAKALVQELQKHEFLTIMNETADALRQELKKKYPDDPTTYDEAVTLTVASQAKVLIHELQKHEFLAITSETADNIQCTIVGKDKQDFLRGDWLETYVWREINDAKFAHDCKWGYRIFTGQAKNELDVAFTYKGILLIAECKTDEDPFTGRSKYLDTLDSISNSLGGTYTSKFFVTSHPAPKTIQSYKSFCEQAKKRGIFIITGANLRDIGSILKQQAETPTIERT